MKLILGNVTSISVLARDEASLDWNRRLESACLIGRRSVLGINHDLEPTEDHRKDHLRLQPEELLADADDYYKSAIDPCE